MIRLKSKICNSKSTKFKKRCQNIEIVDEKSLNSSNVASCQFCKKSFSSKDYNNHNCNPLTKICKQKSHACKLCSLVFKRKNHLNKHMEAHSRNNCRVCTAQLATRKALCKHLKTVHNISEPLHLYHCSFCGKAFCKRTSLNLHLKIHAEGKFVCLKCGFMCPEEKEYKDHMEKHKKTIEFECTLCNKQFVRSQQFNQHMMLHKQHFCSSCDISFSTKNKLIQHQCSHHGLNITKKYECPTCKKAFSRPMHLKLHIRSHTSEKPFKCSHCNKNFTNQQTLTKHLKTAQHMRNAYGNNVNLEKSFLCSTCGATFFRQQTLQRHVETIHMPGETFKCPHCDYNTRNKANLVRHVEGHSNIKRYVCETCGASFRALATLTEHQTFVHSDSRDFVCDTCGKAFKNKSTLQRHLRTHKDDRPYKCHCDQSYKRLSHLKRHMATVHKETSAKKQDMCVVDQNSNSEEAFLVFQQNSTSCTEVLNSQDQNLTSNDFNNSALQTGRNNNFPLKFLDEENESKYLTYQKDMNLFEENNPGIDFESSAKRPPLPISHSAMLSDSRDSVSDDDQNLIFSPNFYLNLENLSTSPLKVHHSTSLDDVHRPRSLPNLNFQTSGVEAFSPFSMRNIDVSASIPPALLLDRETPVPSDEQNNSSKQLFEDLTNFDSNSEIGVVEFSSDNFFNVSKNRDIFNCKDNNKMSSTCSSVEVPEDNYEKMQSSISEFSDNVSSNYSPLLACNLVFLDDPLIECTIDTDSFNTDELALS